MIAARLLSASLLLGALVAFGCGGDDVEAPSAQIFKDNAGRRCTLAQSNGRLSCNATPMPNRPCSAGESACFLLGTSGSNRAAAVCDGCCQSTSTTRNDDECSLILCEANGECPSGHRCSGNTCIR